MENDNNNVSFSRLKLARLKHAYKDAKRLGKTSFTFEGREYDTRYARYLIEYLEIEFKS